MVTSVVPVFATPCLDRSLNTDGTTSYWNNNDYIWEDFDPVEVDGITGAYGPDGKFHPGFEYESGPVGEWDEPDDTYWIFSDGWYGPDPEQWESYQKWVKDGETSDYVNDSGEFSGNKHSHFYQYTEDDTYETNKGIDAYHDTSRLEYEFDRYTLHHTVKKDGKWVFVREDEDRPFVPEETPEYDSSSLNKMTVVSGKD
ncbi:MAG: hypothetical protein K6G84_06560, partial [Lachnospiraceae bacterium]|nr:hypothetical protein [Lachnospiraceae bacterium]